jgi:hypothetical protein
VAVVGVKEKVADAFSQPLTVVHNDVNEAPDPATLMMPLVKVPTDRVEPKASLKEVELGSVSQIIADGVPVKFKANFTRGTAPFKLKPAPTERSV